MEDVYETEIDGFYARQKWNGSAFHVYDVGGVYPGFYRYVCNILSTIAFVTFAFAYFRVFSRNIGKRRDENTWFLNKTYKLRMWGRKEKSHMTMRKTHHIYRCPECKQKIRIPKGKGKIEIRCPKCSARFIKNS